MTIQIIRDDSQPMRHIVHIDKHLLPTDVSTAEGGSDSGPSPHDLYDAALGACKALTVLWYAKRKSIPLDDVRVAVERDATEERSGVYKLNATLHLTGELTEAQRQELLSAADRCPVHKLMTKAETQIHTVLGDAT